MTAVVLAGTAIALVAAVAAWFVRGRFVPRLAISATALGLLLVVGVLVLTGGPGEWSGAARDWLLVLAVALAVTGGGPLAATVLALVDRGAPGDAVQRAGQVLRGGAWIGALERAGVFASLVAGWPEGLAVVLGIKGLARFPELRGPDQGDSVTPHGVAERFIIGTFVSVLWAAGCAALVLGA
ncbi:MAG: hypothetical protein ACRDO1_04380 [Nocardioidaceae bacterium]